jgi:sugar phosphate isomerase/epimerase
MQNDCYRRTGVSPAYFVSRYGLAFSWRDIASELDSLKQGGFFSLQLEIIDKNLETSWDEEALRDLLVRMAEQEISPSVFIAHFMGEYVRTKEAMESPDSEADLKKVLEFIEPLDISVPLAIPLLPMMRQSDGDRERAHKLLQRWAEITAESGRSFLLEIVAGSVASNYGSFMEDPIWLDLQEGTGFLLDTGHAFSAGDEISQLPGKMKGRLKALHVSDSNGTDLHSLPPGKGLIQWDRFLEALEEINYPGALDLEIIAEPDRIEQCYREGKLFFQKKACERMESAKELV